MRSFPITHELALFVGIITIPTLAFHFLFRYHPGFFGRLLDSISVRFGSYLDFPKKLIAKGIPTQPSVKGLLFKDLVSRFKFTFLMLFINIYTYIFTTDFNGKISHDILENLGFSYTNFAEHKWFILVTSNFIHFHLAHLVVNMLMLILFTGSLEYLMGSSFTGMVYITAMNSNIPNGIFLLPMLREFYPSAWNDTVHYVDVGASLGIVGTLGGLARLLIPPARWTLLVVAIVGTLIGAIYLKTLFGLDHAFSALLGYFMASYLLKSTAAKNGTIVNLQRQDLEEPPSVGKTGTDA